MKQLTRENTYQIAIVFTDGSREYHDVSAIKVLDGCLIIVDPEDMIPCEVHCFPFTSIKSFIFDVDAIGSRITNLRVSDVSTVKEHVCKCQTQE